MIAVPYLDTSDARYNNFQAVPKPITQAVMFCLMDVSGSITEHMKKLAKMFYALLYLFLKRRYEHMDIVFIRHTHEAKEVDENTFFHGTDIGGTVFSTALTEMQRIINERYPPDTWNIYAAQVSDGDNLYADNEKVTNLLCKVILPITQYFTYLEVYTQEAAKTYVSNLWQLYRQINNRGGARSISMRRARLPDDVYYVLNDLFRAEKLAA